MPGVFGGAVAEIVPSFTIFTSRAGIPPNVICAPGRKFEPEILTGVPPPIAPLTGTAAVGAGGESTITIAPLAIDASVPRITLIFFAPNAAFANTEMFTVALVGAAAEIAPPYVEEPRIMSGENILNCVPAVMSDPPTVTVPNEFRGIRNAKAGRV